MSGGCQRCCLYGSAEQQREQAEALAGLIDQAVTAERAKALDAKEET